MMVDEVCSTFHIKKKSNANVGSKIKREEMSEPVPTNQNRFGGEHNEIFIGVILTGGPAECGDG